MKNSITKLLVLFSVLIVPFGSLSQDAELPALRLSDKLSKPNRVLKTTINDKSLFKQKYKNTNLTLDYIIRYYFYTSIDLNAEKNQLISMDGSVFNLSSKNAKALTNEVISLIGNMYFGKIELKEFKEMSSK